MVGEWKIEARMPWIVQARPNHARLIADARSTLALIKANPHKSVPTIAAERKRCRIRIGKLLKIACLAPDIVTAIIDGRQPLSLTTQKLLNTELRLSWDDQKRMFGFA